MSLSPIQREAKVVIQRAYEWARDDEERKYVRPSDMGWAAVALQPAVNVSHWMIMPDGATFAHIAEPGKTKHVYEQLED